MSLGMKLVRAHRILNVNNLIYYFVSQKTFNKNFVVIQEIEVLTLDKPVYVGVSILDLITFLIKFHYKHIGTKYNNGTSCYVQAQIV